MDTLERIDEVERIACALERIASALEQLLVRPEPTPKSVQPIPDELLPLKERFIELGIEDFAMLPRRSAPLLSMGFNSQEVATILTWFRTRGL